MYHELKYLLGAHIHKRKLHHIKYKHKTNKVTIHLENGTIIQNPHFVPDVRIRFRGKDSVVELYEPFHLKDTTLYPGKSDHYIIKKAFGNIRVIAGNPARILKEHINWKREELE